MEGDENSQNLLKVEAMADEELANELWPQVTAFLHETLG